MKKKTLLAAAVLAALAVPQVAGAEGFGLVEWSAQGTAMQGARMFAENDAAMVAYNPAAITKVKNGAVAAHITQITPHGTSDSTLYANADTTPVPVSPMMRGKNELNPGRVPGVFFVKKIGEKDWVGYGTFTRYGMISQFPKNSLPAKNNRLSKMIGLSMTPTYAHKFDNKWSAAVGAEINYVDLTLEKEGSMKIKGDTTALGWNAAASYTFDEKNEVGVVYRSHISQHMRNADLNLMGMDGKANAKVILPDQWSIGYNHKFDDRTRVEVNALYTKWRTYNALNIATSFPAPYNQLNSPKNWESGWRYAIGVEHKLSDKYSLLAGASYDGAGIPTATADFMVPTGNRRTLSIGTEYHDKKQTVAATVGYMWLGDKDILPGGGGYLGGSAHAGVGAHTHHNYAPIFSIGYQYNF